MTVNRIQEIRERRQIAAGALASRVGISERMLSAIENASGEVSVETAFRLADALRVPIDALFFVETLAGQRIALKQTAPDDAPDAKEEDAAEDDEESDPAPSPSNADEGEAAKHDVFTTEERSKIMSKVRSKRNESTENRMIKEFKSRKIIGWRRNSKLFGAPDFIFPKERIAVFVDGCFWHGHDCRNTKPKDNAEYWEQKIARNRARDAEVTARLTALGYRVVRVWECDFKKANAERLEEKLRPIVEATRKE